MSNPKDVLKTALDKAKTASAHEQACADAFDTGFAQAMIDAGIKTAEQFDACYELAIQAVQPTTRK